MSSLDSGTLEKPITDLCPGFPLERFFLIQCLEQRQVTGSSCLFNIPKFQSIMENKSGGSTFAAHQSFPGKDFPATREREAQQRGPPRAPSNL